MAIYDVQAINQKNTQKNRKEMTAQEMAVFTREQGKDTETLELEDTTTQSKKAGWFGFGSWIKSWFSEKIEFDFNGTTIKGKNGYQVRGGVVPLFPGVALDLTPASLRGVIDKEKGFQGAKTESKGGKPKVVVSPKGTSFITEHELDGMVIGKESTGGLVLEGAVNHEVSYAIGDERLVKASSLQIRKDKIILKNPSQIEKNEEKQLESAIIDDNGINVKEYFVTKNDKEYFATESEENQTGFTYNFEKGEASYVSEDYFAKVNLSEGTFSFSLGTFLFDSSREKNGEEEKKEAKDSSGKSLKDLVKAYYDEYQTKVEEYWEKLGFAKDAFLQYCKTGQLPENKYEDKDKKEEKANPMELDARIPLFPGLTFKVGLEPTYSFGVGVAAELENAKKDSDEKVEVTYSKGQIQKIVYPKLDKVLKLKVMLRGSLGAKLSLMLAAGIGYLIELEGGITAEGKVRGNVEGAQENTFAEGETEVNFRKFPGDSSTVLKDASMLTLKGGLELAGNVGTEGKVASKLFDWEKELWQYTFKEWQLGDLSMEAQYARNPQESIISLRGWKLQSSSSEANIFGHQVLNRQKDNFGLRIEQNESIDVITENSQHTVEEMKRLVERLKEIQSIISIDGGNFVAPESATYKMLIQEMGDIQLKLGGSIQEAMLENELIRRRIENLLKTDQWKQNQKMANEGIQKHQERIEEMENWNETTGKNNMSMRDAAAILHYKDVYGKGGALKAKREEDRNRAIRSVATKNKILEYERKRMAAVQKKNIQIIQRLKDFMEKNNITDFSTANAEVVKKYKSLGGKDIFKQLGVYGNKESMLKYEREALAEATKKHTERISLLKQKQEEMGITQEQLKQPNEEFAKYYHDKLDGDALLKSLMNHHIDVEQMIAYEKEGLYKTAGKHMGRVEKLRDFLGQKNKLTEAADQEQFEQSVRKWYFGAGKGQENAKKMISGGEHRAKAATKQDILEYEINRLQEYRTSKQSWWRIKNVEKQQGLLKKVKEANEQGGYKKNAANSEWSKIKSTFKEWAEKERTDDEIKELISLESLAAYEQKQIEYYSKKKDNKNRQVHNDRMLVLSMHLGKIERAETEEKRQELIKAAKDSYYSSQMTSENKELRGAINAFKSGEILDSKLIEQSLMDAVQENGV